MSLSQRRGDFILPISTAFFEVFDQIIWEMPYGKERDADRYPPRDFLSFLAVASVRDADIGVFFLSPIAEIETDTI